MPEKWYLNCEPDAQNKNRGGRIDLVVKRKTFHSRTGDRKKVKWTLGVDLKGFERARLNTEPWKLVQGELTDEDAGGEFKNTLNLAPLTGALYTVKAKKHTGAATNLQTFDKAYETWRLVYYDVIVMDEACKAHYEAVKTRFQQAFAEAGYELEENSVTLVAANKREAQTNRDKKDKDGKGGLLMTHLYDGGQALAFRGQHIRLVIVKDIIEALQEDAVWRMTNAVVARPVNDSTIKTWREGDAVFYECGIDTMADAPFKSGTVTTVTASAVPAGAIRRVDDHTVEIDLAFDAAMQAVEAALIANRRVSFGAKLSGRRAEVLSVAFRADHRTQFPLSFGSTEVSITKHPLTLRVADQRKKWTETPVQGEVTRAKKLGAAAHSEDSDVDGAPSSLDVAGFVRENDHELRLDLTGLAEATRIMAGAVTAPRKVVKAVSRGGRDFNEITNPAHTLSLNVKLNLHYAAKGSVSEVDVVVGKSDTARFDRARRVLTVKDSNLTFALNAPLTEATLRAEAAPVVIPAAQVTRVSPRRIKIDLDHHLDLAGIRDAFRLAGTTLKFELKLNATESIGGYSPKDSRTFVALTTLKLTGGETDAVTQDRLLICMLHEVGHAHSIASDSDTIYTGGITATRSNPRHYSDPYGGVGPHCSHNAKLVPSGATHGRLPTSSGRIYERDPAKGTLCVMYHALDFANSSGKFCDTCRNDLRAMATHVLK